MSDTAEHFDLEPLVDRASALVEAAKKAGADAADSVVGASRATGVEIRNGKIEETESSENAAFSLRVFVGEKSASVSANAGGDIDQLAQRAVAMARVSPADSFAGLAPQDRLASTIPDLDIFDSTEPDFQTMHDLALACEEAALAVKGVSRSSGASFGRGLGGTVLATSHGFVGHYRASRFSLSVSAVAGEGTKMERDYDFDSRRHLGDLRDAVEIGTRAGERAVKRLNPRTMKTQSVPVILSPRIARGFVGHIASAVNGASIVRKTSFLRDQMGQQVFSKAVNLVDQPLIQRGVASRPFDGEGIAMDDLDIISDGVLNTWFLDGATARELGMASNGRAGRSGSSTAPSTSNLLLQAGERSEAEMIASIKQGLYVTEVIGQGVNLVTGDYSRGASGYWIEDGELTFPVSEVTIAGKLGDMFATMEPASEIDLRFATNAPAIALESMTLAGR